MRLEWEGTELLLRPATATDRAFIFATWMRSYWQTKSSSVAYEQYHRRQPARIERLWPSSTIACREAKPDTIHAWVCGSPGALHYVYVPPDLREKGLARKLVRAVCGSELAFSHEWPFRRLPGGWRHNEYLLEES